MNEEDKRLNENRKKWQKWGPYLAERSWGTLRENYGNYDESWDFITYEKSVSRAYRWSEDGIGGISDINQILCFSVAFWNKNDPIIKERFFGLSNSEGNHGEDVKEYYYYLDNTPTHSYMKILYKYPVSTFPYKKLREENKNRNFKDNEFELIDTDIFEHNNYFNITIEYAKSSPDDILIMIDICNLSKKKTFIDVIPQLFFRNTWSWDNNHYKPDLKFENDRITVSHKNLDNYNLYLYGKCKVVFCENETNPKVFPDFRTKSKYFKDGINNFIIHNDKKSIKNNHGTKAGIIYNLEIEAEKSEKIMLRLSNKKLKKPFENFIGILQKRKDEADLFYAEKQKDLGKEERNIQRQAFAGMLWSKQFYHFDVQKWIYGDSKQKAPPKKRLNSSNRNWIYLYNSNVMSVPDKWEFPAYTSWDLCFHCLVIANIDIEFAKEQLILFTSENFMKENGQLPAYERNFSAANPPLFAWAVWKIYLEEKKQGKNDIEFLKKCFHKLLINFTWWMNLKDPMGINILQQDVFGMDNIGSFENNIEELSKGKIAKSESTGWISLYTLSMLKISVELSLHDNVYQELAVKFFEHFLHISYSLTDIFNQGIKLWDNKDKFFYDILNIKNKEYKRLKLHSVMGLIPLLAVECIDEEVINKLPLFKEKVDYFLKFRPKHAKCINWYSKKNEKRLLSLVNDKQLKAILKRVFSEKEFLSDYGIRSLSKYHKRRPYKFADHKLSYQAGYAEDKAFGGNSNWRGPVWFPLNYLFIDALKKYYEFYGNSFKIEFPTDSGKYFNLKEISLKISNRLISIFLPDEKGFRPVYGINPKIQKDSLFSENLLFNEYFHGEYGWGLGASHQTGWTGLVANILDHKS